MEPREENNRLNPMQLGEEARARYEILRVVNRGGMGEIALGRVRGTKGFEKLVVLKRLRADAERDDHLAMFDVEQELMSRIEHPNIVKVFDQPIIDNTPYLAMEYVRGRNLDQVIRQAKDAGDVLSNQFCLTAISEVLRGLAFVHRLKDSEGKALGVVHQDITPSNIMVSFFGEVKITDFGISYVTSRDGGLRRGVLKGKPRYVAPEVLAGKRVNNRADIYGVGVVLFELMTQQALFARASVKETLAAVARGEVPDFKAAIPGISEGVLRIFERSLAKDPADRYRTAEEMGADIVAELAKLGGPMSPARLGYVVRQFFRDDPDVPEIDTSFEAALSAESQPVLSAAFRAPDLSQTLSELDRLLPRSSTDLFTLPPELKKELAGIEDMDPFMAMTPIPDFVWDAPNEAEILRRADEKFGSLREPPSLQLPTDSGPEPWGQPSPLPLPSFEVPKRATFGSKGDEPGRSSRPATLAAPSIPGLLSPNPITAGPLSSPSLPVLRSSSSGEQPKRSISASESSPPPTAYHHEPPREMRTNGKRAPSFAKSEPQPREVATPIPQELIPARQPTPVEQVDPPKPAPSISVPKTQTPIDAMPPVSVIAAPSPPISFRQPQNAPDLPSVTADTRKNFSFWLGLMIGLVLGLAAGAALFSYFFVK